MIMRPPCVGTATCSKGNSPRSCHRIAMASQGAGRPLQNVTNLGSQSTQPRGTSSRLQSSKPTIWTQPGLPSAPNPQTRESTASDASWAQAMGVRTNNSLDLSSSAFPSLNSSGQPSQSFNPTSSAWQTGPPQSETTRRQPLGSGRLQGASRQSGQNSDSFFSSDAFSRNPQPDFSLPDASSQPIRRTSTIPNGPPGLVQRPPAGDDVSDPSRVTSPAGLAQSSRSPLPLNVNGAIGQDRPLGDDNRRSDFLNQSSPSSQLPRDSFPGREIFEQTDQTPESLVSGLPENDKWGIKGYFALAEGPSLTTRSLMKGQDLGAHGLNMNADQSLLPTYTGPFAAANTHPLRPLDADFTIPDCYTVKKVAPLHSRINSFSDETLFYIFYSMPRDFMQVLVGQELMERKWRYHMREQMWMMRDESNGTYVYSDDRSSEHGYYIWWDKNVWKKVRRAFTLRYEDLDEVPSVGSRRAQLGTVNLAAAGVNGSVGMFNAVPSLEKLAVRGF